MQLLKSGLQSARGLPEYRKHFKTVMNFVFPIRGYGAGFSTVSTSDSSFFSRLEVRMAAARKIPLPNVRPCQLH